MTIATQFARTEGIGAETGIIVLVLFVLASYKTFTIFGKKKNIIGHESLAKIKKIAKIGFVAHFVTAMFLSQAYSIYWVFYITLSAVIQQLQSHKSEQMSKV